MPRALGKQPASPQAKDFQWRALAVNVKLAASFEIFESSAEVAAAPVGFLCDLCRNCLRKLRIVGEDYYASSFIQ